MAEYDNPWGDDLTCQHCGKQLPTYWDNCKCDGAFLQRCNAAEQTYVDMLAQGYMPELKAKPAPAPLPQEVEDKFAPYQSIYELTLTTPVDDIAALREGFLKITRSAQFAVKGYIACIELTEAGVPHIHALLFSNIPKLNASKIKAMYPHRYECKKVRMPGNYHAYINKEKDNQLVKDYCTLHNVEQIWEHIN